MTTAPAAPPTAPPPSNGNSKLKPSTPPVIGRPKAKLRPPRIVLYAVEGWGKTSCGANCLNPFLLMAKGETGYTTLLGSGRVPAVDTLVDDTGQPRAVDSWQETIDALGYLADENTEHKTIVLDAIGGFERLCHEHVCARDFHGVWGEKGFNSYQKGFDVAVGDWLQLLALLDKLHEQGRTILLLGHSQVRPSKDPLTEAFDRYIADVHHKTWSQTAKWADAILFGNFITIIDGKKGEAKKGIGGTERIIYAEHRDAYDAKNRFGMPERFSIPNDPAAIWNTIRTTIAGEKGSKIS